MIELNLDLLLAAQTSQSRWGTGVRTPEPSWVWDDKPEGFDTKVLAWRQKEADSVALVEAGLAEWTRVTNPVYVSAAPAYLFVPEFYEVLRPTTKGHALLIREGLYDPDAPYTLGEIEFGQPSGYGDLFLRRYDGQRGTHAIYAWSDGILTWTKERA